MLNFCGKENIVISIIVYWIIFHYNYRINSNWYINDYLLFDEVLKTDRNVVIMGKKLEEIVIKAIEDALMNHKLDKADLNYLHLLKPIEKIYLNFTHSTTIPILITLRNHL